MISTSNIVNTKFFAFLTLVKKEQHDLTQNKTKQITLPKKGEVNIFF